MRRVGKDTDRLEITIPTSVANMNLPDTGLLQYYRDFDDRVLWIDENITNLDIDIVKAIRMWNLEDDKLGCPVEETRPIRIFINSGGGDLYTTLSIVDAIRASKTPVYTVNCGMAFSAAFLILIAGHKRYGYPHSFAMNHSLSAGIGDTLDKIMDTTNHFNAIEESCSGLIYERTKIDKKTLTKKRKNDWYLNAEDALKYGIIDEILESFIQ